MSPANGSRGFARRGEVELAWSSEGDGDETLLLVMGLGGRAADWGTVVPAALAERYRVVRFDNRGTGSSTKLRTSWTMSDMAADAVAVLDAVGAERAHVMGISMGGVITQTMALEFTERLSKIVLLSTFTGGVKTVPPSPEVAAIFSPMNRDDLEGMLRQRMKLIMAPGAADRLPEAVDALVASALAEPTPLGTFAAQMQAILSTDQADRLAAIEHPTLILHGDVDPLIPFVNAQTLHEKMPKARFEVLEGAGHLPMWEVPDEVIRRVGAFLAS